jgi:hypothetical protein
MKRRLLYLLVFALNFLPPPVSTVAAMADPALLKSKQEAESKGYVFIGSRDEIVA